MLSTSPAQRAAFPAPFAQGFETAKKAVLEFLETFKQPVDIKDREILRCVARTSLRTKLAEKLADQLTDIIVDAVMMIHKEGTPLDLHMVGGCAMCMGGMQSRLHGSHAFMHACMLILGIHLQGGDVEGLHMASEATGMHAWCAMGTFV